MRLGNTDDDTTELQLIFVRRIRSERAPGGCGTIRSVKDFAVTLDAGRRRGGRRLCRGACPLMLDIAARQDEYRQNEYRQNGAVPMQAMRTRLSKHRLTHPVRLDGTRGN